MKKSIINLILIVLLLSCSGKRDELEKLNIINKNIQLALKSDDREFVSDVIEQIDNIDDKFPEHISLRRNKFVLEIRLERYNDAIDTINEIIKIDSDNIDERIVQGILYEIVGYKAESIKTWEKALDIIETKIKEMLKGDRNKYLMREINRVLILKLLNRDQEKDYDYIRYDLNVGEYPETEKALELLEYGSRNTIIDNYR